MIYFWRDIRDMLYGLVNAFFNRFPSVKNFYLRKASAAAKDFILNQLPAADLRLLLMLVVGTVPAVVFGLALHHFGMEWLRSTKIIGWNILLFGILLWIADRFQPSKRSIADMTYKDAFLIGLAQCLAMIRASPSPPAVFSGWNAEKPPDSACCFRFPPSPAPVFWLPQRSGRAAITKTCTMP